MPRPVARGRTSIVPPSSVSTSVRTICRPSRSLASQVEARPAAPRRRRRPRPRSRRRHRLRRRPRPCRRRRRLEAVLDRVLQQLVSTITSGVATSAGSTPKLPVAAQPHPASPAPATSPASAQRPGRRSRRSRPPRPSRHATASRAPARSSATRRTDSSSARPAPRATPTRRACSRSSAATVCRLFFTRWWISRMVASLLDQLPVPAAHLGDVAAPAPARRSARRPAAAGAPAGCTVAPRASTSVRAGASPRSAVDTARRPGRSPSSGSSASRPVTSARSSPTRSPARPSRRYADSAFGLA